MEVNDWKIIKQENRYSWEAYDINNNLIGVSSQTFASKKGAEYNADLLGKGGSFSPNLEWLFTEETDGWHWKAKNKINKETVGKSYIVFKTKADAQSNASQFGYLLPKQVAPALTSNSTPFLQFLLWLLLLFLILIIIFLLLRPWIANQNNNKEDNKSVLTSQVVEINPLDTEKYSLFQNALNLTGLNDDIRSADSTTLIAPTNEAFNSLNQTQIEALRDPQNIEVLRNIIKNHIVKNEITPEKFANLKEVNTLFSNIPLSFDKDKNEVTLGDSAIIDLTQSKQYKNISVFETPELLLDGIDLSALKTSTTSDSQQLNTSENNSSVTPNPIDQTISDESGNTSQPKDLLVNTNQKGDITRYLENDGRFNTYLSLIRASDLESEINNQDTLSLFIPTDEAFAKIQPQIDQIISSQDKNLLRKILQRHHSKQRATIESFVRFESITAANGEVLQLCLFQGKALVEYGSTVSDAFEDDIIVGETVLHPIDTVLL